MRLRRADPHTLAGAYALDALPPADRAAFERHLGACEACRQEATGLRAAAARLGEAVADQPPQRLRGQVLAEVARTRQLPPAGQPAGSAGSPAGAGPAGNRLAWAAMPRLAIAIAGACLLVALALGGFFIRSQHRLTQEQVSSARIAAVLTAPDATMMTAHGSGGGRATLVMSHLRGALVLTTARLPGLPAGERYEMWLMGRRGVRSAGMLPAPRQGMTAPVVVSGLAAGDRLGVTAEPADGSARPTSPPVLMFVLPS